MKIFRFLITVSLISSAAGGHLCLQCDHVTIPQDCFHVVRCGTHEDCFVDKFRTHEGYEYFSLGCRDIDKCSGASAIGKRSNASLVVRKSVPVEEANDNGDSSICHACCNGKAICNVENLCVSPDPNTYGGHVCFHCAQADDPERCSQITLCGQGQSCKVVQYINMFSKRPNYSSGCEERDECNLLNDSIECCDSDFCNDKLPCKVRLNDNPVLSIPYINQDGDVKFNCTFSSSTSRMDVVYKVSWTVDGHLLKNRNGIDEVTSLSSYEHVAILDAYNLNGNLNKILRCKVEPQCSIGDPLPGSHSNGYWVGIKVSPQRISHTVEQNITLVSTLPVISSDKRHKLYIAPQIERTGQNSTACKYPFEWDPFTRKYISTIPVRILPHSFYKTSDKLFFKQLKDLNFPIFRNYNLPIVQIGSYVTSHDVFHRCELKEGHVNVFDNSTLDASAYSYLELYKTNSTPTIEVQVKRQPCGYKNCSCAIIVREGNDAVQIDTCGQTTSIIPEVTYLSNTSEKHMSMHQTDDGLFFLVTVLSGSNITVNLTGSDPDMHVVLSILDQDKNPPGGICGNETWLFIPGIGNVAPNGQKEPEFLKAWTLPQNASMFKTGVSFDQNNSITDIGYCKCEGPKISCGTII
ncbi:uncharacterized protein LOC143063786 [Mytilus galloprovincialis]|uniref:uncharacterized protein LOC143063786 n=1 Tax=Mytilus galloprovincialis TaxID=29158 RepID=UPI003F7C5BF4